MPGMEEKCYPSERSPLLTIAGIAALILGILLLFVCVPGRVWLALVGVVLIAVGWLLLKLSNVWR